MKTLLNTARLSNARRSAALSFLILCVAPGLALAEKTCDVSAYGATGNGMTRDTAAFQ
jgi:hypothetical protein